MSNINNSETFYEIADPIFIYGLKNDEYNECKGIIAGKFDTTKQRYPVKLQYTGKCLFVKSSNIMKLTNYKDFKRKKKRKASNLQYAQSPKGKKSTAKTKTKYKKSPKRKKSSAKYNKSPKGTARTRKYKKKKKNLITPRYAPL
eukprot:277792_1